jgi:N-acetylglucosaminyldiphosphoundecaprenol N-acetyl-beta-D-mannosaminyltransferase
MTALEIPRVTIGGVKVSALTFEKAIQLFLDAPGSGARLRAHFCTAHTVVEANADPRLMRALNDGEIVTSDGMPLVWLLRLMGHRAERVYGPDVLLSLADQSRDRALSHYFYGGAEGIAERLVERLSAEYPGLRVAGLEAPPFRPLSDTERRQVIDRINASGADYVWVGLGTPKQDFWLAENRAELAPAVLFAVGAAFDFLSGAKPRAPRLMQRSGTEWLFRLVTEPGRLWRRYLVGNVRFVWLVTRDAMRSRRLPGLRR